MELAWHATRTLDYTLILPKGEYSSLVLMTPKAPLYIQTFRFSDTRICKEGPELVQRAGCFFAHGWYGFHPWHHIWLLTPFSIRSKLCALLGLTQNTPEKKWKQIEKHLPDAFLRHHTRNQYEQDYAWTDNQIYWHTGKKILPNCYHTCLILNITLHRIFLFIFLSLEKRLQLNKTP